jgi:hypothetical protein
MSHEDDADGEKAERISRSEPLPFDFVDFVCVARHIERELALGLLKEFMAIQLRSRRGPTGPGLARSRQVSDREILEPVGVPRAWRSSSRT